MARRLYYDLEASITALFQSFSQITGTLGAGPDPETFPDLDGARGHKCSGGRVDGETWTCLAPSMMTLEYHYAGETSTSRLFPCSQEHADKMIRELAWT